jgi:hypothetical protein
MHALFHIRTVIIPRNRYRPEGFSLRVDIGRGMITVLIWKKSYINLFITYFNIELKRIKLTCHTDTKLWIWVIDIVWGITVLIYGNTNKSFLTGHRPFPNDNWQLGGSDVMGLTKAWYRVISVLPRYLPMGWYRYGTSGVYVWAKLTLLLINMW